MRATAPASTRRSRREPSATASPPRSRRSSTSQLDALLPAGEGDLVADYFEPVSVRALGRALGVPGIEADELRRWFHALIAGASNLAGDRAVAERANAVSAEIDARLRPEFERLAREPDGSLLSHMLHHARGVTLEERIADVTPTIKLAISGGLQEPGHGASTVAAALLADSGLRARFAATPAALVEAAVEEGLRWVAPIQHDTRRTRAPFRCRGVTIPAGVDVGLSVASANRDERVFGADADRFDLDRDRPGRARRVRLRRPLLPGQLLRPRRHPQRRPAPVRARPRDRADRPGALPRLHLPRAGGAAVPLAAPRLQVRAPAAARPAPRRHTRRRGRRTAPPRSRARARRRRPPRASGSRPSRG